MIDINKVLEEIDRASFFSNMGMPDLQNETIILIKDVEKVFINPSDAEFNGLYASTEWLPTSPTQVDPFYKAKTTSKELIELRIKVNKAVLNATKGLPNDKFICSPHDFSQAARNGICFAFRQYITEKYLNLGTRWENILRIYYAGHWPVGFAKEKIIAI